MMRISAVVLAVYISLAFVDSAQDVNCPPEEPLLPALDACNKYHYQSHEDRTTVKRYAVSDPGSFRFRFCKEHFHHDVLLKVTNVYISDVLPSHVLEVNYNIYQKEGFAGEETYTHTTSSGRLTALQLEKSLKLIVKRKDVPSVEYFPKEIKLTYPLNVRGNNPGSRTFVTVETKFLPVQDQDPESKNYPVNVIFNLYESDEANVSDNPLLTKFLENLYNIKLGRVASGTNYRSLQDDPPFIQNLNILSDALEYLTKHGKSTPVYTMNDWDNAPPEVLDVMWEVYERETVYNVVAPCAYTRGRPINLLLDYYVGKEGIKRC